MAYPGLPCLYLLDVAMVFGGSAIGSMAGAMARRSRGTRELAVCLQLAARSAMFAAPGAWLAVLTGTAIVWHMGYGFAKPWVVGSSRLWATSFVTAMFVLRPPRRGDEGARSRQDGGGRRGARGTWLGALRFLVTRDGGGSTRIGTSRWYITATYRSFLADRYRPVMVTATYRSFQADRYVPVSRHLDVSIRRRAAHRRLAPRVRWGDRRPTVTARGG